MFPRIQFIDQILPLIKDKPEFVVLDKGNYIVIDYVLSHKDTFSHPLLYECRGIKFKPNGELLARPFHKFRNLGESEDYTNIDFTNSHKVLDKLDGTMIHSAIIDNELVFMTRKGITEDYAVKVFNQFCNDERYIEMCRAAYLIGGATPIFEYTAPDNRIVIKYEKPTLTLLDIRDNYTGEYWAASVIAREASKYGIPLVEGYSTPSSDTNESIRRARASLDKEGIVIRFDSGFRVKVKAEDYVMKHRVLSFFNHKDKVLDLVFEGKVDDTLPILGKEDADKLEKFNEDVLRWVTRESIRFGAIAKSLSEHYSTRKDRAAQILRWHKEVSAPLFSILDGNDSYEVTKNWFNKNRNRLYYAKW